jgi:hypothetical protein
MMKLHRAWWNLFSLGTCLIDLIIAQRLDEPTGYGNGWISALNGAGQS